MTSPLRIAILISGRGSNMAALIQAVQADDIPAQIICVLSNRPNVAGLDKARDYNVEAITLDHRLFSSQHAFEHELHKVMKNKDIDLICCAGFMRILSPEFIQHWPRHILNIHPSLLPKYKGLHTHQRAIDAGDSEHGCTVHWVSKELDGGEIIAQSRIPILPNDTADSLAHRLLPYELTLYPKALKQIIKQVAQNNL